MNTQNNCKVVKVNIIASLYIFQDKNIQLVNMHLSDTRPKQFEDNFGNLWFASELTNFIHIK
jgi:hypothetical protein